MIAVPGTRDEDLLAGEEVVDGLLVSLRKLQHFHHIDAAIAALASAEEVRSTSHDG